MQRVDSRPVESFVVVTGVTKASYSSALVAGNKTGCDGKKIEAACIADGGGMVGAYGWRYSTMPSIPSVSAPSPKSLVTTKFKPRKRKEPSTTILVHEHKRPRLPSSSSSSCSSSLASSSSSAQHLPSKQSSKSDVIDLTS